LQCDQLNRCIVHGIAAHRNTLTLANTLHRQEIVLKQEMCIVDKTQIAVATESTIIILAACLNRHRKAVFHSVNDLVVPSCLTKTDCEIVREGVVGVDRVHVT
jgi:hypothetical protein